MTEATREINGIQITTVRGVELTTADWFARKNLLNPINGDSVLAILKETDKAIYAIYGNKFGRKKTMWIPKSVLNEVKANYEDFWSYVITSDWNTAMNEIRLEAKMWR